MSIHPISSTSSHISPPSEDIPLENVENEALLSYEERHKRLVDTNTRYIWEQMTRSTQNFTQEMIRQSREQQKEDEV